MAPFERPCSRFFTNSRMPVNVRIYRMEMTIEVFQQRKRVDEPHLRVFDLLSMNLAEGTPVASKHPAS